MARELELLVEAGINPADVLRLATLQAAELHGREDKLGSIETGKLADLVLLEENPLDNMGALRSATWVVSKGQAFPVAALLRAAGLRAAG